MTPRAASMGPGHIRPPATIDRRGAARTVDAPWNGGRSC